MDQLIDRIITNHPDWRIKVNDVQRVIKKLIKEKDQLFHTTFIGLDLSIPISLYYDMQKFIPNIPLYKHMCIDIVNLGFEPNPNLNSKEEAYLSNLFKKVKSSLIELEITDTNKIKCFLPLSTIVTVNLLFSFYDVFDFISNTTESKIKGCKFSDLAWMVYKIMNEKYPDIFNKEMIEIYVATQKEL